MCGLHGMARQLGDRRAASFDWWRFRCVSAASWWGRAERWEGRGDAAGCVCCWFVAACYRFVAGKLQPGEAADVFLAGLRGLTVPFGGLGGGVLACAFAAGLPDAVGRRLRAGSRVDGLCSEESEGRPEG